MIVEKTHEALKGYETKLEEFKVNRTWITEEEISDVQSKVDDTRAWLKN